VDNGKTEKSGRVANGKGLSLMRVVLFLQLFNLPPHPIDDEPFGLD